MKIEKNKLTETFTIGSEDCMAIDFYVFHNGNTRLWNYIKKEIRRAVNKWEANYGDDELEWVKYHPKE